MSAFVILVDKEKRHEEQEHGMVLELENGKKVLGGMELGDDRQALEGDKAQHDGGEVQVGGRELVHDNLGEVRGTLAFWEEDQA